MIRSMTGFGRAAGTIGDRASATITVRSVNHRYLETSVRLPEAMWELEPQTRSTVSECLTRGKVDVVVRVRHHDGSSGSLQVNREAARSLLADLGALSEELGSQAEISLRDLISVSGIIESISEDEDLDDRSRGDFVEILRRALDQLEAMRSAEGEGLRVEIEGRVDRLQELREDLVEHRNEIIAESLESYRERVAEIASQAGVDVDQDRLAQETVLLVERGDIAEELARLDIHLQQVRDLVGGNEPSGKKLDFLSQEMLREVNTIGSKSRASVIRSLVIELKTEIERIREQVQNVE